MVVSNVARRPICSNVTKNYKSPEGRLGLPGSGSLFGAADGLHQQRLRNKTSAATALLDHRATTDAGHRHAVHYLKRTGRLCRCQVGGRGGRPQPAWFVRLEGSAARLLNPS
jgi:hypothetical protein